MDEFLKVTAAVLITAILSLVLNRQSGDISILLTIAVCCMVMAVGTSYLRPVLQFASRLMELGRLDHELLAVLLKVVGIGLLSQLATLVCADAGNQSLGKSLQIMTTAIILCISVPVLEEMILLIEEMLGEI